jgi:hypothetical protein
VIAAAAPRVSATQIAIATDELPPELSKPLALAERCSRCRCTSVPAVWSVPLDYTTLAGMFAY